MTENASLNSRPTAAMVAIGDELLTGRTQDQNAHRLGQWLEDRGATLTEVRIVRDDQDAIVRAINSLRGEVDYVFTSGGIGPTHDDITTDAVGAAFGMPVAENPEAMDILTQWYAKKGEEVTDARARMARTPEGVRLIQNTVSGAPGFITSNVYTLAGVPTIFNAMLDALDDEIARGPSYTIYTVIGSGGESLIADGLASLERALKGLTIGSYPGPSGPGGRLAIVCKALDAALARQAATAVEGLFRAQGVEPETVEGFDADGR